MRIARHVGEVVAVLGVAATFALSACTQKSRRGRRRQPAGGRGDVQGRVRSEAAGHSLLRGHEHRGQQAASELGNVEWLYQGSTPADAAAQTDIVRRSSSRRSTRCSSHPTTPTRWRRCSAGRRRTGSRSARPTPTRPTRSGRSWSTRRPREGIGKGHRRAAESDGRQGQVRDRLLRADGREPQLVDRRSEDVHDAEVPERRRSSTSSTPVRTTPRPTRWRTDLMNAHPDLTGLVGECTTAASRRGPGGARTPSKIGKVFTVGLGHPEAT